MSEPAPAGSAPPMPAAFVGHGSPMNALENNHYAHAWQAFGEAGPRPRAVLVVSAHWFINATAVTAMPWPRTIHDFYGFPEELCAVRYPAPGDPALAAEVADVVAPTWVGQDREPTWPAFRAPGFPDCRADHRSLRAVVVRRRARRRLRRAGGTHP